MNTQTVQDGLKGILDEVLAVAIGDIQEENMTMPDELEQIIRVATFEEEGILTNDNGCVLRFRNGAEFQITVKQSK
jgi:hypothetical protein